MLLSMRQGYVDTEQCTSDTEIEEAERARQEKRVENEARKRALQAKPVSDISVITRNIESDVSGTSP